MPKLNSKTKPAVEPLTFSCNAAFARIGVSKNKGRQLIRSGKLRAVVLDGRPRVTAAAISDFLNALPPVPVEAAS